MQVKSGLGMYQDQQGLPRQSYKEQCKEGEKEAVKKKRWENNIFEWTGLKFCIALRKSETKSNGGKELLGPWCPNSQVRTVQVKNSLSTVSLFRLLIATHHRH